MCLHSSQKNALWAIVIILTVCHNVSMEYMNISGIES